MLRQQVNSECFNPFLNRSKIAVFKPFGNVLIERHHKPTDIIQALAPFIYYRLVAS